MDDRVFFVLFCFGLDSVPLWDEEVGKEVGKRSRFSVERRRNRQGERERGTRA